MGKTKIENKIVDWRGGRKFISVGGTPPPNYSLTAAKVLVEMFEF
jgi:hypothetical protein